MFVTALGSPIRVPMKIALIGFFLARSSKPDLKSREIISNCSS